MGNISIRQWGRIAWVSGAIGNHKVMLTGDGWLTYIAGPLWWFTKEKAVPHDLLHQDRHRQDSKPAIQKPWKDWAASDYAGRVGWPHAMYEARDKELDTYLAAQAAPGQAAATQPQQAKEGGK